MSLEQGSSQVSYQQTQRGGSGWNPDQNPGSKNPQDQFSNPQKFTPCLLYEKSIGCRTNKNDQRNAGPGVCKECLKAHTWELLEKLEWTKLQLQFDVEGREKIVQKLTETMRDKAERSRPAGQFCCISEQEKFSKEEWWPGLIGVKKNLKEWEACPPVDEDNSLCQKCRIHNPLQGPTWNFKKDFKDGKTRQYLCVCRTDDVPGFTWRPTRSKADCGFVPEKLGLCSVCTAWIKDDKDGFAHQLKQFFNEVPVKNSNQDTWGRFKG